MRAVIIDDEEDVHQVITRILDLKCPHVRVVGNARSVKAGVEVLEETKPDLLFLDIKMPGGTGFDILEKLEDLPFRIIFVTAYDEFAIKAIRFNALDYVLKPINSKDLVRAVEKAPDLEDQRERMQAMLGHLNQGGNIKRLTINSVGKVQYVDLSELIQISSDGPYSTFHMANGQTVLSSKPLKDFEALLEDSGFFRIHRSHLINMRLVVEYHKKDTGDRAIMKNGDEINVYRKKRKEFLAEMEKFNA